MSSRLFLAFCCLAFIPKAAFALPGFGGEGRPSFEVRSRDLGKSRERKPDAPGMKDASLGKWHQSEMENNLLARLDVTRAEMTRLVREFKGNKVEYTSFQRLIRKFSASSSAKSNGDAVLLRGYFKLMTRAAGQFHLSPRQLEGKLQEWSTAAKVHLGEVLDTASQLAKESKAGTREQAFEMALKQYGLDGLYRQRCGKK